MSRTTSKLTGGSAGLAGLLLLVGIVLFLFPEPTTSFLGLFIALAGAVLWLAGKFA